MVIAKKIKIAFLLDDFHSEYSLSVCQGAFTAAKELGISLVFFGVGVLNCPILYTSMRNKLFSLIDPVKFDGIVYISGSLSKNIGIENYIHFIKRYDSIPSAHIGIIAPNKKNYNINNYSGMYELVDHIIKVHKRRKIAFIGGVNGDYEADERLRAYREALENNDIKFDRNFIYYGDFIREKGIKAIEEFIDKRKIKFNGLVGANDQMILYAMKELQKRGYKIPEQISIGGFDNLACARSHLPALTTVHQPTSELGYLAISELVKDLISGTYTPENIQLPTKMVIRQSCGCQELNFEAQRKQDLKPFYKEMSRSEHQELDSIINIMTRNIIGSFEKDEIRKILEESLKLLDIEEFSLSKYEDNDNSIVFFDKKGNIGKKFPSKDLVIDKIDSLSAPFYRFVMPLFYRDEDIGFFVSDPGSKAFYVLEVIRDHLSGALKGAQLLEEARQYTARLEKKVKERTSELAERSKDLRLALKKVEIAREKMEKLAIIDELTGLYNRRGFMTIAKQNMELIKRKKSDLLIVFLDLDGLKFINDNFGHENGDIAIKALGTILLNAFRKSDIIARLGGDEFTVLAMDCTIEQYDIIIDRMNKLIEEYNLSSAYKFSLSVSCGAAPCKPCQNNTIEELMSTADKELYRVKRMKKIQKKD